MSMRPFAFNLSTKLLICLIGSMAFIFGIIGVMSVRMHRQHLLEAIVMSADRTSDVIRRSTRYSMLKDERKVVYQIINTIAHEPGMIKIRIFNKEGKITFSTDPLEINSFVNKQAEACYGCHSRAQPLSKLSSPDRSRDYYTPDKKHVLGLIRPIENEPACASAGCHAHPEGKEILGVLDVVMSLDKVDTNIAERGRKMLWQLLGAMVAISGICIIFILFMVHRPVKKILLGTHRVARGDLDFSINIDSNDEIGELGNSFNQMTQELKKARAEITSWAQTLEKRVEERTEQLRHAHAQILQAEKMASVGKLAAIVAHEINNPLAGIRTYARLLLKKLAKNELPAELSQDSQNFLGIIESESARCGEIVKNLLQFSRPSKLELCRNNINTLLRQAIRLVQHQIDLLNAEARLLLADDLPEITCDGQKVQQALVALFINACEAMPQEGGVLEVQTYLRTERQGVEITVSDNGVGMDEETCSHIFEPFFTTKEEEEQGMGLGLGLSVVLGIINLHQGQISVQSQKGRGTTFTIFLPKSPSKTDLIEESEETALFKNSV